MDIVDPGLARALERFERILTDRFPDLLQEMGPGLDDIGIERLREAVAPYLLPAQVEQLYRWRSGGEVGLFGGWFQNPVERLLEQYRFRIDTLGENPLWLPVFDDRIVNVVTLDLPGNAPSDHGVWFGHTHDGYLHRLVDSIEALVETVSDGADSGRLERSPGASVPGVGLRDDLDVLPIDETYERPGEGRGWNRWRLARSPHAHTGKEDTPRHTFTRRWAALGWLPEWMAVYGTPPDAWRPRGATHTVADALTASAHVPIAATLAGTVTRSSGDEGQRVERLLDDGSGSIALHVRTFEHLVEFAVGDLVELDVFVVPAHLPGPYPGAPDGPPTVPAQWHVQTLRFADCPVAWVREVRPGWTGTTSVG